MLCQFTVSFSVWDVILSVAWLDSKGAYIFMIAYLYMFLVLVVDKFQALDSLSVISILLHIN
ncbi:hypothetical protein SLEP1_g59319 [Rubroshorea leprosula]|uniref:Uncharacterized protein n=1 Tax=Rubroshorea leprosula TaxID=152421 RepID=A0AAV5MRY6_9ROSI|nr:hypothetical protein SLEP1_g59319 [Rubroshorea leprosula]